MADKKLTDLPAVTSLGGDELFYVVDDPSGVPADGKITAADLLATVVAKAGGTMTGPLVLSGDATAPLEATPLQQVQALIAALVDASPATLDTLNELAAALADDPNFATTISNLIATKETPAGAQAKVDAHDIDAAAHSGTLVTQVDFDVHLNDITDSHDASSVSVVPAGVVTETDVQAALVEVGDLVDLAVGADVTPVDVQQVLRTLLYASGTALTGGQTVTGSITAATGYNRIVGVVSADQAGTLYIGHADVIGGPVVFEHAFAVSAGVPVEIDEPVLLTHLRYRYVNGGVAQGSFFVGLYMVAS